MTSLFGLREPLQTLSRRFERIWRGLLVAIVIAVSAQFLSEHYGAPAMLMALLLGIAFHFLTESSACVDGIDFTARTVLRFGVALLGARISMELMIGLGPELIALVVLAVIATILFGYLGARALGRGWRFGILTGGSVAICGASAAMALSAILPRNEHSERNLIFTVMGVTILSTLAMILYPVLTTFLEFDDRANGVFLGGTIHDVAQVVGAGFSVSNETGETATLVKLIRVMMLAPVVLILSMAIRASGLDNAAGGKRPPLVPGFVLAFLCLAGINSAIAIPAGISDALAGLSRWALLTSIAAVGIKTSIKSILQVGGQAITLIVLETVFIAALVIGGIILLG